MHIRTTRTVAVKLTVLLLLLALISIACSTPANVAPTEPPAATATTVIVPTSEPSSSGLTGEIPIGVHWCLTGGAAYAGTKLLEGTELAADEINDTSFLGEAKLKLYVEDDGTDNAQAVSVAEKLIHQRKVVAIVGGCTSGATIAAVEVAKEARVPWVVANAVAPGIASKDDPDNWIYRTSMPYTPLFEDAVKAVVPKFGIKTAAIIEMSDQPSTVSMAQDYDRFLKEAGVDVVAYESVLSSDTDFTSVLTKIKSLNPDALLPMNFGPQAANIILQARQLGIDAQILGQQGHNTPDMCQIAGKSAEGLILPATWFPTQPNPSNQHFVDLYRAKHGEDPDLFVANGYTGTWVLARGIKAAGEASPTAIRQVLDDMKEVEVPLGDGKIVFDDDGEGRQNGVLLQVVDAETCKFDIWQP